MIDLKDKSREELIAIIEVAVKNVRMLECMREIAEARYKIISHACYMGGFNTPDEAPEIMKILERRKAELDHKEHLTDR